MQYEYDVFTTFLQRLQVLFELFAKAKLNRTNQLPEASKNLL